MEGAEWQRRRALGAGVVVRGCIVMETVCIVCDVLWSVPVMRRGVHGWIMRASGRWIGTGSNRCVVLGMGADVGP